MKYRNITVIPIDIKRTTWTCHKRLYAHHQFNTLDKWSPSRRCEPPKLPDEKIDNLSNFRSSKSTEFII